MGFCPRCGTPLKPGYRFCPKCGQPLAARPAPPQLPPLPPPPPPSPSRFAVPPPQPAGEYLIGGVYDPDMGRGFLTGYVLYFTNRRIIGIRKRGRAFAGRLAGAFLTGAITGVAVGLSIEGTSESRKAIAEIDRQKKDLEVYKEEIAWLEFKKPGWFSSGHLVIVKRNGERIKIKNTPEKTLELLQRFYPEALRIV